MRMEFIESFRWTLTFVDRSYSFKRWVFAPLLFNWVVR